MAYRRCFCCLFRSGVCQSGGRQRARPGASFPPDTNSSAFLSNVCRPSRRFFCENRISSPPLCTSAAAPTLHAALFAAKTRSAVEDAAEMFTRRERRRLYSIYRPSANVDASVPPPEAYVRVIQKLSLLGMGKEAKTLFFVLAELLKKPVHPSQAGGAWDVPNGAMGKVQASALEALMFGLEGEEALSFACSFLVGFAKETRSSSLGGTAAPESAMSAGDALFHMFMRCLRSGTKTMMRRKLKEEIPGYQIMLTPEFVCAVVIALIRLDTNSSKLQAMEILQCASIARLRGLSVFDEHVAVKSAEAAAVIGDAETVTRIVFILYRARGILTSATDNESSELENSSVAGSRKTLWDRFIAHLGDRQWITVSPTDNIEDEPFHRASLRLLKSVIHAALQSSVSGKNVDRNNSMHEALRLFHSLRAGCHWNGIASMAVELLTHMVSEAQRLHIILADDDAEDTLTQLFRIQCEVQRVVAVLRDSLPRESSPYQKSTYSSCVALAVGCYFAHVSVDIDQRTIAVPIMGVPMQIASTEKKEYIVSAAKSVLFLYDTMDAQHKAENVHILLTASVAALASTIMFQRDLDGVLRRLGEVFLRGGSSERCPKSLMMSYSSNDDDNTSAALWLWNIISFFDKYSGSLCKEELFPAGLEASVAEWVLAALPKQREILWNVLARPECHQIISLHENTVVHVVEQVLETNVTIQEAICMIRLMYSQFKYNCESHFKGRIVVNKLLSCLSHIQVLATDSESIVKGCASELLMHDDSEKAVVVVGAHDVRLACEKKVNFLDWIQSIAENSASVANFPGDAFSPTSPAVVLTIDAFLFVFNQREQNESAFVPSLEDVLSCLRQTLRDAPAAPRLSKLPPLFLLAPFAAPNAKLKDGKLKDAKLKDGVAASCAVARSAAAAPLRPAQAARFCVYLWEEDTKCAAAAERSALARDGVRFVSARRVRTQRARADVTQIIRAANAHETRGRGGRRVFVHSSRRAGNTAVAAPSRSAN